MLKIILYRKKIYVFNGNSFYGPYHSIDEARYRAAELKNLKPLDKVFKSYQVLEILQYEF